VEACPSAERLLALIDEDRADAGAAELERHVDGCPSCRDALVELAAERFRGSTLTEDSRADGASVSFGDEQAPSDAGRYVIEDVFSRGGLGLILRARDQRLGRTVAIKQILGNRPEREARLRREALITARLQHPAIVPVYEAGHWPTGEPFYVMRLVAGRTLAARIREASTREERVGLLAHVIAIADAVAYAHNERIIHRDLKPANVIIGDFGETVVLDRGLAKSLDEDEDGVIAGTPCFMAPEQAIGAPVDERADVYAIGAILDSLLSGSAPSESAPPLAPAIPKDLSAIVEKAMAADPAARYRTAKELRDDLRRFQTGQLVSSYRYSALQLVGRFVARHRLAVALASILLLQSVVGGVEAVRRISTAREVAEAARAEAEKRRDQLALAQARGALGVDPTAALAWIRSYPVDGADWRSARRLAAEALAAYPARHVFRDVSGFHAAERGDLVAIGTPRGLELCRIGSAECRELPSAAAPFFDVLFSPDDRLVAAIGREGRLAIFDVERGESELLPGITGQLRNDALAFSGDGRLLAILEGDRAAIWNFEERRARVYDSGEGGKIDRLSLSRDGRRLAVAGLGRKGVRVFDVASGEHRLVGAEEVTVAELPFSADNAILWSASELEPAIDEHRIDGGARRRLRGHSQIVLGLILSRDGRTIVSGDDAGELRLWDLSRGESRLIAKHPSFVSHIDLSSDGAWVASAGADGVVWLSHLASGDRHVLRGHAGYVSRVQFTPDGSRLLTHGDDRTLRVWDVRPPSRRVLRSPGGNDVRARPAFSADGAQIAWASNDGAIGSPVNVEFSSRGQLFAAGATGRVWDPPFTTSRVLRRDEEPHSAYFSRDGRSIAAPGYFTRRGTV
jgi:WD40 repeat protein/tRNA A-37 threonylcarbamoyl transferase component Bud32